jgi:tRNA(Ile)-lysidine synthase
MLSDTVQKTIAAHQMLEPGDRVVVAVSGGPDSVALCHLLTELRPSFDLDLIMAHVHHGLRGAQADEDLRFVQDLGQKMALPVMVQHLDVRSWQETHRGSLQMAARTLRYRWLRQVMVQEQATKLALGHNADDQAEEVLLRVFRGSGQRGLTGMPPRTLDGIIRPLLDCHRHQILAYLNEHGLTFREDTSNLQPWCQRNRLRLEVLPQLRQEFNSNLDATLIRTTKILQEEEDYWQSRLKSWLEQHDCQWGSSKVRLPIAPLLSTHPAMQRRLFRRVVEEIKGDLRGFGFRHTEILLRLCRSGAANRQIHLPGELVAEKSYGWLTIARRIDSPGSFSYEIPESGVYPFPDLNCTLEVEYLTGSDPPPFGENPLEVVMDRDRIAFPLTLRSPEPGDRFRPLGLGGSKKVKDFFMDVKIPRSRRRLIPILCSPDHIVWIVGHRVDDRVKVTPQSTRFIELRYKAGV